MRDFTRMFLRLGMVLFLVVGCGYNLWYMKDIAEVNHQANIQKRYNPYHYNSAYNDVQTYEEENDTVEAEDIEEYYQNKRTINYPY